MITSPTSSNPRLVVSILPADTWQTAIEATQTPKLLAVRVQWGLHWIFKSVGALKALRSLSSDALVQFLQEPTGCVFHALFFPPVLSPVPVLHESNMQTKGARSHEQCTREYE